MDLLSIIGLLVAFTAIILGQYLEGGQLAMLVNAPALIIVAGGTIGATMVQSPWAVFERAARMVVWIVYPPKWSLEKMLSELVGWCRLARREGLLGLESVVEAVPYDFAKKGLQLLIDGNDPVVIRETLELDSHTREQRDLLAARVYESMGGYSPTLGILGAVIGLIHVMHNLSDPALLGEGVGVAFVATVYGVALANLVFIPAGNKLKAIVKEETRLQAMVLIGIVAIAEGENPRVVESRLQGLIA